MDEQLENILFQAMCAAATVRATRDRLLQFHRVLQQAAPGDVAATADDVAARLEEVVCDVWLVGLVAGTQHLTRCLKIEAESSAGLALDASISGEPLYHALLAQRLPARPTTRTEALYRIQAALYAVKLPREHHLPRCIQHLRRDTSKIGHPDLVVSDDYAKIGHPDLVSDDLAKIGNSDLVSEDLAKIGHADPVSAATDDLAKIGLSNDPAAEPPQASSKIGLPATAATTGEPPQAAKASSVDLDQARTYLNRACTLTSLAVKHIHIAVTVLSSFLDPKEVAGIYGWSQECVDISDQY